MYKHLIFIFITTTFFACKNNTTPSNCKTVHTGTFAFTAKTENGETLPFTIYRNDSIQTEVANQSNESSVYTLSWTNDCQYDLLLQKTSFGLPTELQNTIKSIPLQTTINYVGTNFYVFTAERKANNFLITDTMRFAPLVK